MQTITAASGTALRPLGRQPARGGRRHRRPSAATPTSLSSPTVAGHFLRRQSHIGLERPDRLRHGHTHPGRAGHLHPQRHRDLHRYNRQLPGRQRAASRRVSRHSSYTLTASFSGDSSQINSDRLQQHLELVHGQPGHDRTLTYTGPTTAVNGQSSHAQRHAHDRHPERRDAAADQGGHVHRWLGVHGPVLQRHHGRQRGRELHHRGGGPAGELRTSITTSFAGDVYDTSTSTTTPTTVTEPTTPHGQHGHERLRRRHHGLRSAHGLGHQRTHHRGAGHVHPRPATSSCTATTDATGTASCSHHAERAGGHLLPRPGASAATSTLPLQLTGSNGSVELRCNARGDDAYLHRRDRRAQRPAARALGRAHHRRPGREHRHRRPQRHLHPGQRERPRRPARGATDPTGAASCTIGSVSQSPGPDPGDGRVRR